MKREYKVKIHVSLRLWMEFWIVLIYIAAVSASILLAIHVYYLLGVFVFWSSTYTFVSQEVQLVKEFKNVK